MRLPILVVHICAGMLGVLSGAVAISFRKGSRGHQIAGNVFVIAMLFMGISATYLALLKSQVSNVMGGILTVYLVGTAWSTARRKEGETSWFDWAALVFALAVGASQVIFGLEAVRSASGLKYGYPAALYFAMGTIVLLASAGDVRMLVRGGVYGSGRLIRHLWRMCFAFFFATGSFFLGKQELFPEFIRRTNILFVPAFLPLALLIFWFIRVRFTKAYKARLISRPAEVHLAHT